MILLSKKKFTLEDQTNFSDFSGDYNPIHLCNIYARKTIYGQIIVHGINILFWSLDLILKKRINIQNIKVKFFKPAFLDEILYCYWNKEKKIINIKNKYTLICKIKYKLCQNFKPNKRKTKILKRPKIPQNINIFKFKKFRKNEFGFCGIETNISNKYSNLTKKLGIEVLKEIGFLSYIVGMKFPGLYSLFLSADISFKVNNDLEFFKISKTDKRINYIWTEFRGKSIYGYLESMLRPKEKKGLENKIIKKYIKPDEFKKFNSLVIGGSRGIGNLVTKIIAIGGGKVRFTYHKGKEESDIINKSFSKNSNVQKAIKLNILSNLEISKLRDIQSINSIFYFPSPKIIKSWNQSHDESLFEIYKLYYFHQFRIIVNKLSTINEKRIFFYPSTILIDKNEAGFNSYTEAKMLGEKFCSNNKNKNIKFYYPRLPKLLTDQNNDFYNRSEESNLPIILKELRKIQII